MAVAVAVNGWIVGTGFGQPKKGSVSVVEGKTSSGAAVSARQPAS